MTRATRHPAGLLLGLAVLAAACGVGDPGPDASGTNVEWVEEVVVEGLAGPTQLVVGDDGSWWVAQLAGAENDGAGQVLRVDSSDPGAKPIVALDGLDKPTGLALFAGELWVMERDRLTRGPVDGVVDGTDRRVVADELPNNGRSQGTLTVDGDRLLFNTSGRLTDGGTPVEGSGILWSVTADGGITQVATGFKHAYAHARAADGTLYVTEIGDGLYDGEPPDDELVPVTPGVDHGWPACVGDNREVAEYAEANGGCLDAPRSRAVFPPGATPTSVAAGPSGPVADSMLVALWNLGEVVIVPVGADTADDDPGSRGAGYEVVYEGAERPQHLANDGDRVLLTDFQAGTVIALEPVVDPDRSAP